MTRTPRDLDILQQHIRVLNPRNTLRVDWAVLLLVLTLAVIGFLCLFSASRSAAASYYQRQIVYFLAGCLVAWLIVCIDHRFLVSLAPVMYGVAVGLLIAVLDRKSVV